MLKEYNIQNLKKAYSSNFSKNFLTVFTVTLWLMHQDKKDRKKCLRCWKVYRFWRENNQLSSNMLKGSRRQQPLFDIEYIYLEMEGICYKVKVQHSDRNNLQVSSRRSQDRPSKTLDWLGETDALWHSQIFQWFNKIWKNLIVAVD